MHFLLAALIESSNELRPHTEMRGTYCKDYKGQQWSMHSFFFFHPDVEINCFHSWTTGTHAEIGLDPIWCMKQTPKP